MSSPYKLGFVAHYVSTNPPVVLRRFFKSDRSTRSGAVKGAQPLLGISFVSFSLCLLWQRKAAKKSWYVYLVPLTMTRIYHLSAFSFEEIAPKEKALQKENGVLSPARRAVTFLRKSNQKTFLIVWCGANIVRTKSQFRTRGNCFPL